MMHTLFMSSACPGGERSTCPCGGRFEPSTEDGVEGASDASELFALIFNLERRGNGLASDDGDGRVTECPYI